MRMNGAGRTYGQFARATAALLALVCSGSVSPQSYRSLATGEHCGFRAGTIVGMCVDGSGTWCATVGRLQHFDGYHWHSAAFAPPGPVKGLASAASGGVFVWGDAWVCRVSSRSDSGSRFEPLHGRRVQDLVDTESGTFARLAVPGTLFGQLVRVRSETVESFSLSAVTDLALDEDGSPLVAASRRVYRWNGTGWRLVGGFAQSVQRIASIAGNIVCALGSPTEFGGLGQISVGGEVRWSDGDGAALGALGSNGSDRAVYASSDGRLHVHRAGEWTIDALEDTAAGPIEHLCFSPHGLWVARGDTLELLDVREDRWVRLSGAGESAAGSVLSLTRRADGSLWWVTRRVLMRDGTPVRSVAVAGDRALSTRGIRSVAEGGDGRMWAVGSRVHPGVFVHDGNSWDHLVAVDGRPLAGVDRVRVDRGGTAWFLSAVRAEVFAARAGAGLEPFDRAEELSGPAAAVAVAASRIWFAVRGFGVEGWDPARSEWRRFSIPGGAVDVAALRDGAVWCLSRGGQLARLSDSDGDFNDGGFEVPALAAGRRVLGILADGDALWATTPRGLLRIRGDHCSEYPWPVGVQPKGPMARDDEMLLCATASDGVVALPSGRRHTGPIASVLFGGDDREVTWVARPSVLHPTTLKVRHRTDGGDWSEWGGAEGAIRLSDHEVGEHALEIEVASATGRVERFSRSFRVAPPPDGSGVGFWLALVAGAVVLGCGAMWFRPRTLRARGLRSSGPMDDEAYRQTHAMAALGQLTGVVAHDFNNVLQVIVGYGETADDVVESDPEVQFMIRQIVAAGEHGAELVRQLARLPVEESSEPQVVDLQKLVAQKISFLRRLVGEDVKIELRRREEPQFVSVDPIQVTRVLLNLAANARDALPAGGRIRVEVRRAEPGSDEYAALCRANGGDDIPAAVVLDFEDDGAGMDEATVRRVFEPFFSTKREGEGTGLGMAMVRDFADEAGGAVVVESQLDEGTHVWIALPAATQEMEIPRREAPVELPRGNGERVLVVEDNRSVRRQLVRELEQLGYRVLEATCWDGVRRFAGGSAPLDVAIVDMVFADRSGVDAAGRLCQGHPDLPVVFVTGNSEHGPTDWPVLHKPVAMSTLAAQLRQALDGGVARRVGDPSGDLT